MTAQARFKQADVKRAASGVEAAGLPVARVEIDPNGKIVVIVGQPSQPRDNDEWADLN